MYIEISIPGFMSTHFLLSSDVLVLQIRLTYIHIYTNILKVKSLFERALFFFLYLTAQLIEEEYRLLNITLQYLRADKQRVKLRGTADTFIYIEK